MLVTTETNSGPPSRTPSIMESPTLARVERARLRLEASSHAHNGNAVQNSLERKILDPKVSIFSCIVFADFFVCLCMFCMPLLTLRSCPLYGKLHCPSGRRCAVTPQRQSQHERTNYRSTSRQRLRQSLLGRTGQFINVCEHKVDKHLTGNL